MTMKALPFAENLREKVIGYAAPRHTSQFWKIEHHDLMKPTPIDTVFRVEASMFFQQVVSEAELQQSRHSVMEEVKERAIRAIAHEVYGPVERELREILHMMWQDGLHNSEAAKRIDAMIPILRGEPAK